MRAHRRPLRGMERMRGKKRYYRTQQRHCHNP